MSNPFSDVMQKKSDEELIKIASTTDDDYQPLAIEAAKKEISKRDIAQDKIETISVQYQAEKVQSDAKANEPLDLILKVISFLIPFPGTVIRIIFLRMYYERRGYRRKASDIVTWTLLGVCFYAVMILTFTRLLAS